MSSLVSRLLSRASLHTAVESGDTRKVHLLTQEGADVNGLDKRGCTPMHIAARNGYEAIVGELLDRQATASIQSQDGLTPLHEAATKGHHKVMQVLLGQRNKRDSDQTKLALLNMKDRAGRTPLSLALEHGHLTLAAYLCAAGANPNVVDAEGASLLMAAARKGDQVTMQKLFELGASLEGPRLPSKGWTPLHQAAAAGHEDAALWLAYKGANLATKDNEARTPIDVAKAQGHFDLFKKLHGIAAGRGQLVDAADAAPGAPLATRQEGAAANASGTAGSSGQVLVDAAGLHQARQETAGRDVPGTSPVVFNYRMPLSQVLAEGQAQHELRSNSAVAYPQLPPGASVYI